MLLSGDADTANAREPIKAGNVVPFRSRLCVTWLRLCHPDIDGQKPHNPHENSRAYFPLQPSEFV
jgi:hypothetical protein